MYHMAAAGQLIIRQLQPAHWHWGCLWQGLNAAGTLSRCNHNGKLIGPDVRLDRASCSSCEVTRRPKCKLKGEQTYSYFVPATHPRNLSDHTLNAAGRPDVRSSTVATMQQQSSLQQLYSICVAAAARYLGAGHVVD